jgi:hypothetical protein
MRKTESMYSLTFIALNFSRAAHNASATLLQVITSTRKGDCSARWRVDQARPDPNWVPSMPNPPYCTSSARQVRGGCLGTFKSVALGSYTL